MLVALKRLKVRLFQQTNNVKNLQNVKNPHSDNVKTQKSVFFKQSVKSTIMPC